MAYQSTPESYILDAVCEYLSIKRYFFWRNNNGGVYDASKKIFRKFPKWCIKGVSDIVCLMDGTAWFIEVKAPKKYQTPEQKEFQKNVEKSGCKYLLVRSVDDLIENGF